MAVALLTLLSKWWDLDYMIACKSHTIIDNKFSKLPEQQAL
jgi:hypothetical protein